MGITGYIAPELTGKLQSELSPSLGIMRADIPNVFGASKVPVACWRSDLCIRAHAEVEVLAGEVGS